MILPLLAELYALLIHPSRYSQITAEIGELPNLCIVDTMTATLSLSLRSRGNDTECVGTDIELVITLCIHLNIELCMYTYNIYNTNMNDKLPSTWQEIL